MSRNLESQKTPGLWLGVFVCALFGGALAWGGEECRANRSSLYEARLESVVDGDTLRLASGEIVRLIGVNAPELGRDGDPDQFLAEAAGKALQAAFADPRIWLQVGGQRRDRHGRLLAHVFSSPDGEPVEARLLRLGLGWQVAVPPNLGFSDCLGQAEAEARIAERGVWGVAPVVPGALRGGGFALVDVTLRSVRSSGGAWWLETGKYLVLRIDHRDLVYFGEPPSQKWVGQRWLVRGWVVDRSSTRAVREKGYAPLMLRLRHPLMRQVLSSSDRSGG